MQQQQLQQQQQQQVFFDSVSNQAKSKVAKTEGRQNRFRINGRTFQSKSGPPKLEWDGHGGTLDAGCSGLIPGSARRSRIQLPRLVGV